MSQLRKMRPVDKCTRINTPMYSWLRDATTAKSPGAKTGICSLGVGGVTHGKRCQCEHLHHATVCCREAPSLNYMTAKETTDYREEILGQTHVLGRQPTAGCQVKGPLLFYFCFYNGYFLFPIGLFISDFTKLIRLKIHLR